jgi:hypothetical protein
MSRKNNQKKSNPFRRPIFGLAGVAKNWDAPDGEMAKNPAVFF